MHVCVFFFLNHIFLFAAVFFSPSVHLIALQGNDRSLDYSGNYDSPRHLYLFRDLGDLQCDWIELSLDCIRKCSIEFTYYSHRKYTKYSVVSFVKRVGDMYLSFSQFKNSKLVEICLHTREWKSTKKSALQAMACYWNGLLSLIFAFCTFCILCRFTF